MDNHNIIILYLLFLTSGANITNMPIKKSAKKALRQSIKRKETNLKRKDEMKNAIKKIKKLKSENKTEETLKLTSQAYKAIDKAAKAGVIKKQAASRKKSRLAKFLNK